MKAKQIRRIFGAGIISLFASLAAPVGTAGALAGDYPDGPVQIIVSYGAGGGTDTLARLLAEPLSAELGQPVTVQNMPGAGGAVATTAMLREEPNGLSILATNQPDLFMGPVVANASYGIDDLQVILVDLQDPRVMLVQKDSDIDSFDDFVKKAKAEPGKLAISVAQGSAQEIFAKWLGKQLGLDVRFVGYNGGSASANALLAGEVTATIGDDFARLNIRDKSKALIVGSANGSARWPEAKTLTEALAPYGVEPPAPDFLARYGVYAVPAAFKAKHPEDYAKLQAAMLKARESADFQAYIEKNGVQDLSIGKPGEDLDAAFAASIDAVEQLQGQ